MCKTMQCPCASREATAALQPKMAWDHLTIDKLEGEGGIGAGQGEEKQGGGGWWRRLSGAELQRVQLQ